MKNVKDICYGLFVLTVAYSYSIYFIVETGFGIPVDGPFFKIYSGVLTLLALFFFLFYARKNSFNINRNVILICFFTVLLFYLTRYFYFTTNERYQTYFLSMGVRFIPALLVGASIIPKENECLKRIKKALPIFILIFTVILAQSVLFVELGLNASLTYNTEGGLNYQTISYYSIFAFGLTLFLLANNRYNILIKSSIYALLLLQIYIAVSAGGRGAFLLALIFLWYYRKHLKLTPSNILKLFLLFVVLLIVFYLFFADSQRVLFGFNRISNFFSSQNNIEQDDRWIRWGLALDSFESSPFYGHGLGSVFYEVGFYSHNCFLDILCEGGVLLFGFFIYLLVLFYKKASKLVKKNSNYEIIIVIFLSSFILLCFSGYYLSESGIWFAMTYIIGNNNHSKVLLNSKLKWRKLYI